MCLRPHGMTLLLTVALVGTATGFGVAESDDALLRPGDVVAFIGGTNMVWAQRSGMLETLLTEQFANARPKFRDLAWEADTVFRQGTIIERWRKETWGGWQEQLTQVGANVVVSQFGQLESLAGEEGLNDFVAAYNALLDEMESVTQRIVLVSPTPFERMDDLQPDLSRRNADLALYVAAIRDIAAQRRYRFVDMFQPLESRFADSDHMTTNGMHVAPEQQGTVARRLAEGLGLTVAVDLNTREPLREAIVEKHRLWVNRWRTPNWKCLWGDDGERRFGMASPGGLSLRDETDQYPELIEQAEARIWQLVSKST